MPYKMEPRLDQCLVADNWQKTCDELTLQDKKVEILDAGVRRLAASMRAIT